ncbi:hypothetical protein EDD18DRAFT_1112452 [Armillaria luteobubalina]|uniref:Uncharacterized protein n=1 Tax=Armillaria luteobubalina TaxID=153913 RepID=A0AA39UDP3_9AGAR|nr:hypothetical protein EDD18DRAFT_1112452 [Armillaria luteobubalina]
MDSPETASLGMTLSPLGIVNFQAVTYYKNHPDDWLQHFGYYFLAKTEKITIQQLQVLFNSMSLKLNNIYWLIVSQNSYKAVLLFVILAVTADFNIMVNIYSISNFLFIEQIKTSIWTVFTASVVSDFAIAISMKKIEESVHPHVFAELSQAQYYWLEHCAYILGMNLIPHFTTLPAQEQISHHFLWHLEKTSESHAPGCDFWFSNKVPTSFPSSSSGPTLLYSWESTSLSQNSITDNS